MRNRLKKILRNEFWRKLVKNVATVLVGNGGSSIINFIVTIILVKMLGNTEYGIFLVALQYMSLIDGIVNFQSWAGVIKYGSEAIVEKNDDNLAAIFKSGFIIDLITAFFGTIVALAFLPAAKYILNWNSDLVIMAAVFSLEILFHIEGTSIGVLRLFDKFNLTATQVVAGAIIKLVIISTYMLSGGSSPIVVCILYVIADVIKHLLLVFFAFIVLHHKMGIWRVLNTSIKFLNKNFFKYTVWNNMGYTVDVPVRYFDVFIISMVSVEMVAIYKVFKQIIQVLSMLVNPISMAILPQFSELIAEGRGMEAYSKVIKLRNVILGAGLAAVIGSLLLGKPLFSFFLGTEYGNNLFLFEVLLIIQIGLLSYVTVHPFFASLGKAKQDFTITLVSNLIYMLVAFLFVSEIGIYAVVIATAVQGYICVFGKMAYARRLLNKSKTTS